jgi:hypothetical protein
MDNKKEREADGKKISETTLVWLFSLGFRDLLLSYRFSNDFENV